MRHNACAVNEVGEVRGCSAKKINEGVRKWISFDARQGVREPHVGNEHRTVGENGSTDDDVTQKGEGD